MRARGDQFFTCKEMAHELRVDELTLAAWRKSGRGPKHANVGRRVIYWLRDFNSWIGAKTKGESRDEIVLRAIKRATENGAMIVFAWAGRVTVFDQLRPLLPPGMTRSECFDSISRLTAPGGKVEIKEAMCWGGKTRRVLAVIDRPRAAA